MRKKSILKPSNLAWPERFDIIKIGMTQSKWSDYLSCKREFLFKINGYGQPLKEEKTNFGSIIHEVNDKIYSVGKLPSPRKIGQIVDCYVDGRIKAGTLITQQQLEMDSAKAHAVMTGYFEYYPNDFKTKTFTGVEKYFEEKFSGCTQRGKIDGNFLDKKKQKWLIEHKSKGRISEDGILLQLPLDFQNLFYILNDEIQTGEQAKGVLYNVVRNPQLKLGKNESVKNYYNRILESCRANPEHFYKRWENVYTKTDHELFRHELSMLIDELRHKTGMEVYPNRFSCTRGWQCEFLKPCSTDSMATLTKSTETMEDYMFPELKEVKNASEKNNKSTKKMPSRKATKRKGAVKRK